MGSMALAAGWMGPPVRSEEAAARFGAREALPGEACALARTLASAFAEEPATRWLLPTSNEWARAGAGYFRLRLRYALAHGVVLTCPDLRGGALWLPPGSAGLDPWQELGFRLRMRRVLRGRMQRARRLARRMQSARPPEPHWYLASLGTHPDHRGRGIATRLLQPVLERCDAEGRPAYLETSTPASIGFYRRRGFRVRDHVGLPGGPPVVTLWREPCR